MDEDKYFAIIIIKQQMHRVGINYNDERHKIIKLQVSIDDGIAHIIFSTNLHRNGQYINNGGGELLFKYGTIMMTNIKDIVRSGDVIPIRRVE